VALAISCVQKGFSGYDFSSSDFGEVHATGSFCSSASTASDMLQMTIANILVESETPEDASDLIAKACNGFRDYVTALTSALPVQAFKADVALLKSTVAVIKADAPTMKKHPHAGVALAIAHAAHAAASAANQAGTMISDNNADGGTDDDEATGDGMGDKANGGKKTTLKSSDGKTITEEGDLNADDPLMSPKNPAKKADAGLNGTGAGAELGDNTGSNPRATADDEKNTAVNAKPGGKTSGSNSGMPAEAMAPTNVGGVNKAATNSAGKAGLDNKDQNDGDSTIGNDKGLPAKAKSPTKVGGVNKADLPVKTNALQFDPNPFSDGEEDDTVMTGESQAGEGAAQGPTDSDAANERGTADDLRGSKNLGRPGTDTMDHTGIPVRAMSPTTAGGVRKADADIGKKGNGKTLPDEISGAGAEETDAQTLKSDHTLMQAISALSKQVQESIAGVKKDMGALGTRVEAVATMAKKTDAALNGTMFNETGSDAEGRTQKSDRSNVPPLLDTGYSRRTAA
jgi:hypothetical protein